MAQTVSIQLDGSSAAYEVKHEIDDIYKAILISNPNFLSYPFPTKIILLRTGDSWTSDCPIKEIGSMIAEKIVE